MAISATAPAPASDDVIAITMEHRRQAERAGVDADLLVDLLKAAIGDVGLLLKELIAVTPNGDRNLAQLEQKARLFKGQLELFGP
jgi:hypothetical protein